MCCSLTIVQIHIHCVKLFCMSLLVACKHSYFSYKTEVRTSKRNYNAQMLRNMLWNGLLRKYAVLSVLNIFHFRMLHSYVLLQLVCRSIITTLISNSSALSNAKLSNWKEDLTFFKCLFAHLVKVFFWMASRSSAIKENLNFKYLYIQFC